MTTIPSRLARTTKTFKSLDESRRAVIQLYREWYRGVCANLSYETVFTRLMSNSLHCSGPGDSLAVQSQHISSIRAATDSPAIYPSVCTHFWTAYMTVIVPWHRDGTIRMTRQKALARCDTAGVRCHQVSGIVVLDVEYFLDVRDQGKPLSYSRQL